MERILMDKNPSNLFTGKQELRNKYLACRNELSLKERKEKSGRIRELLKKETAYRQAQVILVYMDYRSEVITTELAEELFAAGRKRVFAPKVEGMDIVFYEVRSMEDLAGGYQGIREPCGDASKRFEPENFKGQNVLVLVPGAVFDREGGRIGYGKGFYDRFLKRLDSACEKGRTEDGKVMIVSAALSFDCQIAKKVLMEAHDRRVDMIVTETGVIKG